MTKIIAEIGVNHCGSVEEAIFLIEGAARAGAWGVKFQLYVPELLDARKERQLELKKWTLTKRELMRCRRLAAKRGLAFGASCFDNPSVELLRSLGPDFQKVACGQWWPGMRVVAPMIFYSYTRSMTPIECETVGNNISLLCVPKYPAKPMDYLPIPSWARGISDHCSYGLGAGLSRGLEWAEVHVCDSLDSPDLRSSCDIDDLEKYIKTANMIDNTEPVKRTRVALKRPIKGQKVAWLRGVE